ncbi:hypothetical protein VTK26DRAFT_8563 [Humicola hyalothermophila]
MPPSTTPPPPPPSDGTAVPYTQFACIGTGFSGICLGATLARWYGIADVALFSRDADLGGTWAANRYPGAACDVPSALYSFSFARNPAWSRVLPARAELVAYLRRVAARYGLVDKMVFNAAVERAVWCEERGRWRLEGRRWRRDKGRRSGEGDEEEEEERFVHECQVLVAGTGQFGKPRELDVPGVERFKGPVFHSARWREDVDLKGKRVVLFGNGCTAAQIVPAIVHDTEHLTQVVRSKHWVYPPIDGRIPEFAKTLLRTVPGLTVVMRSVVYCLAEADWKGFALTESAAKFREKKRRQVEKYMRETAPEKYHDMLIPDFEVGCKRRIFDSGYLESLHAENLTLTDEKVVEILPEGVRMESGKVIDADVIVLANGFATNEYLDDVEVVGRAGETLKEHWRSFGGPGAYNCTALSGFPNFFLLFGPNAVTGHTSAVMAIENAVNYTLRVLRPVLEGRASIACVKRPAEEAYVRRVQAALQNTVWTTGCNSWYIRGAGGKVWNGTTYPWSQAHVWYSCLFPVWKDWEYTGKTSKSSIVERQHRGLWFLSFLTLCAGGLFAWAKNNPRSRLAAFLTLALAELSKLKALAMELASRS